MATFIKHYALEIYTVLAMMFMVITTMMDSLSSVQQYVVVFNFLFILHEWEEGFYPGGFVDLIAGLINKELTDDLRRTSRIPTGILLIVITLVPFFFDSNPMFAVSIATFGLLEGTVHTLGIKLFHLKKKYTPGLVTALMESALSISLLTHLATNWYDYVLGVVLFLMSFALMQKTLTMMVGIRYSDMPKLIRKQLKKKPED